jgi:hypothetical protein
MKRNAERKRAKIEGIEEKREKEQTCGQKRQEKKKKRNLKMTFCDRIGQVDTIKDDKLEEKKAWNVGGLVWAAEEDGTVRVVAREHDDQ